MGAGRPKAFLSLAGRPLLLRAAEAFEAAPDVEAIVAVRRALLEEALAQAARDGVTLTDEAMAVERLGHRVAAVVGSLRNLKITTPHDLRWAELLLASAVEKS